MCLYTTGKKKKAMEDIICYKVFLLDNGNLRAPFRFTLYKTNEIIVDQKKNFIKYFGNLKQIYDGFMHSFKTKKTAIYLADLFNKRGYADRYVVYKCRIPKNSFYYEGESYIESCKTRKSYASKRLEVLKEIKSCA